MTNELDELSEINPVRPDHLFGAVAIDRQALFDAFEADDHRSRPTARLRSVPTGSVARVGYVGAGLLVAAGFAAIAVVGIGDLSEDEDIVDPAILPESEQGPDGVPVVEVPPDETNVGEPPITAVGEPTTELDEGDGADGAVGADRPGRGQDEPSDETESTKGSGDGKERVATACQASGPTKDEAARAYDEACSEPRADCDNVDDAWVCSSEILGRSAPGLRSSVPASDDASRPAIDGPFDPEIDMLSLHYDRGSSRDDALASVLLGRSQRGSRSTPMWSVGLTRTDPPPTSPIRSRS